MALFGVLAGFFVPAATHPAHAFDVCDEDPPDTAELISVISPQLGPTGYGGEAPVTVVIRIAQGLAVFPTATVQSQFEWGDGAITPIAVLPCPGGEDAYWVGQDLVHQYADPGTYTTTWRITVAGQLYSFPFIPVTVVEAASPAPTPAPTVATTVPPTPSGGGAAAGATPEQPIATATATEATTTATQTPTARPTPTPTPSPTPTATSAPAATVVVAGSTPGSTGGDDEPPPNADYRPDDFVRIPTVDEISTDSEVVATNLMIAGVTVWVLFTTVLLNQVLQDHRGEIDRRTAWLSAPASRAGALLRRRPSTRAVHPLAARLAVPLLVLGFTGLVYSVLEPGFGANKQTAVLFGSAVAGVGLVTYLCSGLEAVMTRRYLRARAAVRPFPACIAIAIGSVALSRLLDLHPGVMYGFVASCAVAGPVQATARDSGRVALAPVTASLAVAVAAWLLIGPARDFNGATSGWFPAMLEATAVVVLLGGIEGIVLSMLPLRETDGGKIYRWHRWLWLAIAFSAAFLTWHVLLGRERAYFSGLREASSMSVFVVFIAYTALTVGLWCYFRFRPGTPVEVASDPSTAG